MGREVERAIGCWWEKKKISRRYTVYRVHRIHPSCISFFFFFCPPYDYMANDGCAIARRATSADCKLNLGLHYIDVHYIYSILYIRLWWMEKKYFFFLFFSSLVRFPLTLGSDSFMFRPVANAQTALLSGVRLRMWWKYTWNGAAGTAAAAHLAC